MMSQTTNTHETQATVFGFVFQQTIDANADVSMRTAVKSINYHNNNWIKHLHNRINLDCRHLFFVIGVNVWTIFLISQLLTL